MGLKIECEINKLNLRLLTTEAKSMANLMVCRKGDFMKKSLFLGVFILCLLALTAISWADGFIIVHPLPDLPTPTPLSVKYHRVNINVDNQISIVKIDQMFKNPNNRQLEGTYLFPLPEDSAISKFAMDIDGKMTEGKLLDKDEARKIYEDIVRKLKDPAILEYAGKNTFSARIFPIPANGEKRLKLEYTEILKMNNGLVKLVYPLSTEKFSSKPLEEVTITVKIKSKTPIKNVYSPSHSISVKRVDDYTAWISYEKNNVLPDKDFIVYYSVSEKDFGLNLTTYKADNKDGGYFLLLISPKEKQARDKILPKEVVFVIDTSGSMQDNKKIDSAKSALKFCLSKLNAEDTFNVVSFCDTVTYFSKKNLQASDKNKKDALSFAGKIDANGGTNIYEALDTSLGLFSQKEKPRYLIFLTDGLPTVGEVNIAKILDNAKKQNKNTRIYAFGVGYDVNTTLLDQLANNNKGLTEYISPGEEIETSVSNFYAKISEPVLSDIKLTFSNVKTKFIYPKELPDIFKGSQLVVLGQYEGDGSSLIELTGKQAGKTVTYTYEEKFTSSDKINEFIPQLWATRRIGYLLETIRTKGENKELVDEIVRLSKKYGIITPYTSFLVLENGPTTDADMNRMATQSMQQSISASAPASGKSAVQQSQNIQSLKKGEFEYKDGAEKIKKIGGKTFYLKKGVWIDADYKNEKTIKVTFLSKEYYQLTQDKDLAKYLSVGDKVIISYKGKVYEVK